MATAAHSAAIGIVTQQFKLADRVRIQNETIRAKKYTIIGRLTSLVWEAQRNLSGFSQSRPRYQNSDQAAQIPDAMKPFSESQTVLWASITLDWLTHKNAPVLAVSWDRQDLLLPNGLTPLPDIPDPRWMSKHTRASCPQKDGCRGCVAPRIPQLLTGCPVVGDRVKDMIKDRSGRPHGVIHPILELCVMLGGNQGGFGRIRGGVGGDGTHLALLIDDSDPRHINAHFVGGRFDFGG